MEGAESLAPLLFDEMPTPAQLLPEGAWVVVADSHRSFDRARQAHQEAEALAEAIEWPSARALRSLDDALEGRVQLRLTEFAEGLDLGLRTWGTAQGNAAELARALPRPPRASLPRGGHGARTWVARARQGSGGRRRRGGRIALAAGFVFEAAKLAVATEEDLFGSRRHTRTAPRFTRRKTESIADELEPGISPSTASTAWGATWASPTGELAGAERDYLILEYAQGDKLFVPSDQVGMVARYIGGDAPRLHRMGGSDWARATTKVKRAVRDMAGELVRLYTVRMSVPGHAFGPDTPWQRELEDAFPHEETSDQVTAIDEVKADMELAKPMDRLICGDVGFGKTEIAVRAAFKAVMEGKQVAVLVPTTVLAEQHFITFSERFAAFPVTVEMLCRFVQPGAAGRDGRRPPTTARSTS